MMGIKFLFQHHNFGKETRNSEIQIFIEVFDHGLSYYNIKSPKFGLHLPFDWYPP